MIRRARAITPALAIGCAILGFLSLLGLASADSAYIGVARVEGAIDGTTSRFVERILDDASEDGAGLVLIELDTPGGLRDASDDTVAALLASRVPVAVYVAPDGAEAAGAGALILASGHIAAMVPGATAGSTEADDAATTLSQDTQAFVRSIADARGRSPEALEAAVSGSRSYTSDEALEAGLIDIVATDRTALLAEVDGREVTTAAGTLTLETTGTPVTTLDPTFLERLLGILANPNVAALLIAFGCLGILIELLQPGTLGPGIAGAALLALGFVGAGQLPLNWIGFALIVAAMVLFYVEVQVTGLAIAGFAGTACLVAGLILLFGNLFGSSDIPEPSFRPSVWLITAMSMAAIAALAGFAYLARTTGSRGFSCVEEADLVGRPGLAVSDLQPSGRIDVSGTEWVATTDAGDKIREGDAVRIVGVYGNVLKVVRLTTAEAEAVRRESSGGRWSRLLRRRM